MKKIMPEEQECIEFYRKYGISEWNEKTLILTDEERSVVTSDLEEGNLNPLIDIVKLPFPQFVTAYYSRFPNKPVELNDPAFGYKLYLLTERGIAYHAELLRNPDAKKNEVHKNKTSVADIEELFRDLQCHSLEEIAKMYSYKGNSSEIAKRYVYIMQYVDAKEAERLGLKGLNFYSNGEYKGFDLEGKLNSLNDSGRIVLAKFLGLYGAKRRNKTQVAKDLNWEAATNAIANFVDFVLPNLTLSTGAFQNALGLACTTEDGIHKYQKGQFKNIDVTLQMRYLLSVMATDNEREVLKNYGNKDVLIYIMRKYFIKDNKELSEYLVIPMPEIEATFK